MNIRPFDPPSPTDCPPLPPELKRTAAIRPHAAWYTVPAALWCLGLLSAALGVTYGLLLDVGNYLVCDITPDCAATPHEPEYREPAWPRTPFILAGTLLALALAAFGPLLIARRRIRRRRPTPAQALATARPDTLSALKAVMPGVEVNEAGDSDINCGGPDFIDSKDASKIRSRVHYEVVGDTSDHRSPGELVDQAVGHLKSKGWKVERKTCAADDMSTTLSKTGVAGIASIAAKRFTLRSGKDVPILNILVMTDCLPNPDWKR